MVIAGCLDGPVWMDVTRGGLASCRTALRLILDTQRNQPRPPKQPQP